MSVGSESEDRTANRFDVDRRTSPEVAEPTAEAIACCCNGVSGLAPLGPKLSGALFDGMYSCQVVRCSMELVDWQRAARDQ
jgi:hypothetical protein